MHDCFVHTLPGATMVHPGAWIRLFAVIMPNWSFSAAARAFPGIDESIVIELGIQVVCAIGNKRYSKVFCTRSDHSFIYSFPISILISGVWIEVG
jgi:hypothetical protein